MQKQPATRDLIPSKSYRENIQIKTNVLLKKPCLYIKQKIWFSTLIDKQRNYFASIAKKSGKQNFWNTVKILAKIDFYLSIMVMFFSDEAEIAAFHFFNPLRTNVGYIRLIRHNTVVTSDSYYSGHNENYENILIYSCKSLKFSTKWYTKLCILVDPFLRNCVTKG